MRRYIVVLAAVVACFERGSDVIRDAHDVRAAPTVDGLGDGAVRRMVEYKLLSGHAGVSPVWQMVQHVVNHASYHRGQITTMLRQLGAPPPKSMDMIAYYRTREVRS